MKYLTIAELANTLDVSEKTIRREINDGKISVIKIRNSIRIDPAEVDGYLKSCEAKNTSVCEPTTPRHHKKVKIEPLVPPYLLAKRA